MQAGVDTFRVGKLMAHEDSKMVERYYGHLKPKNLSDSMALLPRFAGGRGTGGTVCHWCVKTTGR